MDEYLRLTPSPSGAVSERMQALLSRAVEEQVNEQREVVSLLSDVRNALAEVQRDSGVAPGRQADLRTDLANHASEMRTKLASLDERLEAVVGAVGTSAQVLQGISGQLERVVEMIREQGANTGRTEPMAQVRREVADVRTQVDSVESVVRGDVAALQQRLAADVDLLQGATEETARTIANHVDNAVLVLAEALLRRPVPTATIDAAPVPEPDAPEFDRATDSDEGGDPAGAGPETVADDDPLWGASFRIRETPAPVEEALPGTSTWAAAAPAAGSDAPGDGDDAGALVDGERSDALPSWRSYTAGTATAYDDPLGDLPSPDEPQPGLGLPAAAPYDLERSLFGDRARPVAEVAPVALETVQAGDHDTQDHDADVHDGDHDDGDHDGDDESGQGDEIPRRRPWWRPAG